jgi:hypothetical protein
MSLATKFSAYALALSTALGGAGCATVEQAGGGIKQAATGAWGDVTRVAGATVNGVSGGASSSQDNNSASAAPAQSSVLNPGVVALINQKLAPSDAQKLVDIAEPYVTGSGQLSRQTRRTITGIGNRELQGATKDIPVLRDVARSAGNNTAASEARQAQIAQMVVNANNAAIKADQYRSAGNARAADSQMRTAASQVDAATRAYTNVFGANSLEEKHIGNAYKGGIYNETTRQLNKVQPGGLPGFLDKVFK